MSDEYEPDSPIISVETPSLTGTPTTLMGSEGSAAVPDGTGNYDFITGPDGQTYAVMKEPFVWKKFFIGLGIPLFLMVVPIILAMIAEGMDPWDDAYEWEQVDLELVNGTEYASSYTLDSDHNIEWCNVREDSDNVWYSCHHDDNTEMHIHKNSQNQIDLIRGNNTSYYANFSLESGQMFDGCDIRIWDYGTHYWCDYGESPSSEQFIIIKETWGEGHDQEQVGHWNSTSGVIHFDDGGDHGIDVEIEVRVDQEVGQWTQDEGVFRLDSGEDHGASFTLEVETIDMQVEEDSHSAQNTVDVLLGISWIMCMGAPLISIGMVIYGFAASGGKAMGVGGAVALASFPIIGFFGCVAVLSAGY